MTRTTKKAAAKLNTAIAGAVKRFAPPESLTVDEWADKHRRLSPESSAEAGPWRTKRTPYLEEPMRAFTDPKVHKIVMVAASQVGKSELELNIIGYIIDQDPGSILYVHPTIDDARKFSRLRVAPMIRDSKSLKAKVHDVKAKDSGNTALPESPLYDPAFASLWIQHDPGLANRLLDEIGLGRHGVAGAEVFAQDQVLDGIDGGPRPVLPILLHRLLLRPVICL